MILEANDLEALKMARISQSRSRFFSASGLSASRRRSLP
jgi:hypothetical protein